MDHYSFNRPRRDGWLSWPCWLTDSGRFTHKVVARPAISLAQDRESSTARTGVLTTMLRSQLILFVFCIYLPLLVNKDFHTALHEVNSVTEPRDVIWIIQCYLPPDTSERAPP